jgi:hypothetical protein
VMIVVSECIYWFLFQSVVSDDCCFRVYLLVIVSECSSS